MKRRNWFRAGVLALAMSMVLVSYNHATNASSIDCPVISGHCPAQTGTAEVNSLGYSGYGDSVYKIHCSFFHVGSSLVLSFSGSLTEGLSDESWGLDNVVVKVNGTEVVNNDFETNLSPGWSNPTTDITPSGRMFLGQFGSQNVTLTLNGLPTYKIVTVSFDLFIIQSWDGDDLTNGGYGPDRWTFGTDGSTRLTATFSNVIDPNHTQTFCPSSGCTPGYWKNHPDAWGPTGLSPNQTVSSVFTIPACLSACSPNIGSAMLLDALRLTGGSSSCGAARILLRSAVAARLNAGHGGVNYPRTPAQVVEEVNSALASCNRITMLQLALALEIENNLGCPF